MKPAPPGRHPKYTMIRLARLYDEDERREGEARVLVDRVWPRGRKRDSLGLDEWLKDAAPSAALRTWFNHDPERWEEFRRRYRAELELTGPTWAPLLELARQGPLLLLYGARDREHNNAVVLREFLLEKL